MQNINQSDTFSASPPAPMKIHSLVSLLAVFSTAQAAEDPVWVERLAFWSAPEMRALKAESAQIDTDLSRLPAIASLNSGNRTGFQSAGKMEGEELWVEVELAEAQAVDSVVMVPLLAKGSNGLIAGFGFPKRFTLEGIDADGEAVLLMDETAKDFPNPGLYPVTANCPEGTILRQIRLTATAAWENDGPPVLALAEMLVLKGNRNLTWRAKVHSPSSREISPTWSRGNLVDMMTPLGLPLAPGESKIMGWHGPVAAAMDQQQTVILDLGKAVGIEEIRLVPAISNNMAWGSNYGFPTRFKVETSLSPDFQETTVIHDRSGSTLLSPGQNLQIYGSNGKMGRYVKMTANRLRDRTGDYVFALGELQVYSGNTNVAMGAAVVNSESLESGSWSRSGLTDGSSGGGTLLELPEWFRLLEKRRNLEKRRIEIGQRRSQLFVSAEHALVGTSVGGAGSVVLLAAILSWRGRRQRVLDRERHRERLARDLHDELGSNLGSIALISSFAGQEDAAQMRLDLAEIERVARESADSMRDMVSLLGGKRGGAAADWLHVMTGLAERLLRGVELDCGLPTTALTWQPNLETRREIYLFCKEALHNAAKHAHPQHLKFHLSPSQDGLHIEISDDGCGFDRAQVHSGHGIGNLRERAAMMRAKMNLTSSVQNGTTITLDVPRGRRWTKR